MASIFNVLLLNFSHLESLGFKKNYTTVLKN